MIKTRKRPVCSYSNNIDYITGLKEQILNEFITGDRTYRDLIEIEDVIRVFEQGKRNDLVYANKDEAALVLEYITRKEGAENGEQNNLQTQYCDYSNIDTCGDYYTSGI